MTNEIRSLSGLFSIATSAAAMSEEKYLIGIKTENKATLY